MCPSLGRRFGKLVHDPAGLCLSLIIRIWQKTCRSMQSVGCLKETTIEPSIGDFFCVCGYVQFQQINMVVFLNIFWKIDRLDLEPLELRRPTADLVCTLLKFSTIGIRHLFLKIQLKPTVKCYLFCFTDVLKFRSLRRLFRCRLQA